MKNVFYFLIGISLFGCVISCNEKQDKNVTIFNMLKDSISSTDTINDFKMAWDWKYRTINTDLYGFDIVTLDRQVELVLDSIIYHKIDKVDESLWRVLNNDTIRSMFDIFNCWIVFGKFHWAVRPIHNSYGYSGSYRINNQNVLRDIYAVYPFDNSSVSIHHPGVFGMLDDDDNLLYFGERVKNFVYLYRNIDRLLNIADSLEAKDEFNIKRGVSTIY